MHFVLMVCIIAVSVVLGGCQRRDLQSKFNLNAPYSFASPSPESGQTTQQSQESLEDAIKSQLARKYNKQKADINLVISQQSDQYASGALNFVGEMGGALWFAAKSKGGWILVHDGQGPMSCELAEQYSFPSSMVKGCVNGDQVIMRSN